eukprot:667921-Prorocentrum_minimum.AAC.1
MKTLSSHLITRKCKSPADYLATQVQMAEVADSLMPDAAEALWAEHKKAAEGRAPLPPLPVFSSLAPGSHLGSVTEKFHSALADYCKKNPQV